TARLARSTCPRRSARHGASAVSADRQPAGPALTSAPPLERFADLIVEFGANVQPSQIVAIGSEPGKEELTRAIATSAYRHGARFVDVAYFDPHVKRARIEHAPEETLDFVPTWY